ncbi:hypothetical protein BN2497_3235 [Janthinobacterium sp. CG23_2]|nr:hypothetical protein BN2497_3235 [Janthinobacterium sp. CG23_2]CUU28015.1 hypothetical protein BN3177_3235 [Janthinobacterium sp. CG23_2]
MKFLAQLYDFMFAPAGVFDTDMKPAGASEANDFSSSDDFMVNPSTGLLMIGGIGGIDAMGNSFGVDNHHDESASMFDHCEFESTFNTCSTFD